MLNSRVHVRHFAERDMEALVFLASAAPLRLRKITLAKEAATRRVLERELALDLPARPIEGGYPPEGIFDRLSRLLYAAERGEDGPNKDRFSRRDYLAYRETSRSFQGLVAFRHDDSFSLAPHSKAPARASACW